MVEVVTVDEFNEFQRSIEDRLDAIERKLNDLIKDVNEKHAHTQSRFDEAVRDLNKRIDDLSESSKGFIERLRDALRPSGSGASRAQNPSNPPIKSNPVGNTEKTLGKVTEVIMRCSNFFDWDWCQENCPMYLLCDNIATIQDVSKLSQGDSIERVKGMFKRLEAFLHSKSDEESPSVRGFST